MSSDKTVLVYSPVTIITTITVIIRKWSMRKKGVASSYGVVTPFFVSHGCSIRLSTRRRMLVVINHLLCSKQILLILLLLYEKFASHS